MLEILKSWYDEKLWKVEFSPERDCALITRLGDGCEPREVYPIMVYFGRMIGDVRQTGESVFTFTTGDVGEQRKKQQMKRVTYSKVLLTGGKIIFLDSHFLPDEHKMLYSENGVKWYRRLLQENNLEEAEPTFAPCFLLGERTCDPKKYEVITSQEYFIVRDKKSGKIHPLRTQMECLGYKQVSETAFLGLFGGRGAFILKRMSLPTAGMGPMLQTYIAQDGFSASAPLSRELELRSLNCQLDADTLYTKEGIYSVSYNRMVPGPGGTVEKVIVRRKKVDKDCPLKDGKSVPLALVSIDIFWAPKVLALMNPVGQKVVGKALNLVSKEFVEADTVQDLRIIAEKALRERQMETREA